MNFKILWIDDEPSWIESIRKGIEEHITRIGFTPEIICQEDGDQIDQYISRSDIDMMVIDCNLDEDDGKSGDHLIEHVRKKGNFLEIVFYSQDHELLSERLCGHKEHVHCVPREGVDEKVNDLIGFAGYKYADCGYMRGSVIAEAIDIENILEEIMVSSFGPYGERFRTGVLDKFKTGYDFYKKFDVQSQLKTTCSALEMKATKTSVETTKLATLKNCRDIMCNFHKEVVEMRNILAHARKEWDKDGKLRLHSLNKTKNTIEISREWMMKMRSVLAKYRGVLNQISEENLLLEPKETEG